MDGNGHSLVGVAERMNRLLRKVAVGIEIGGDSEMTNEENSLKVGMRIKDTSKMKMER